VSLTLAAEVNNVKILGTAAKYTLISSALGFSIIQILLGGSLSFLWGVIQVIQLVYFLPLMKLDLPPILIIFFS